MLYSFHTIFFILVFLLKYFFTLAFFKKSDIIAPHLRKGCDALTKIISQKEAECTLTTKYCRHKEIQRDVDTRPFKKGMVIKSRSELFRLAGCDSTRNPKCVDKNLEMIKKHVELEDFSSKGYKVVKTKTRYEPCKNHWHSKQYDDPRYMLEQVILYTIYNYTFEFCSLDECYRASGLLPDNYFSISPWEDFEYFLENEINALLYRAYVTQYHNTVQQFFYKVLTNLKRKHVCEIQKVPTRGMEDGRLVPLSDDELFLYKQAHQEAKEKLHTNTRFSSVEYLTTLKTALEEKGINHSLVFEGVCFNTFLEKDPQLIGEHEYLLYRKRLMEYFIECTDSVMLKGSDSFNHIKQWYEDKIEYYLLRLSNPEQLSKNLDIKRYGESKVYEFSYDLHCECHRLKKDLHDFCTYYDDQLTKVKSLFFTFSYTKK